MIVRFDKTNYEHVEMLKHLYHDPTATEFFRRAPRDLPDSALAEFEASFGVGLFVIQLDVSKDPAGLCIVSDMNIYGRNCQVGIAMKEEYRHLYSQCSFVEMLYFLFMSTALHKVYVTILDRRIDLETWCKKHSMRLEAVLQDNVYFENAWHTELMFSYLRDTFFAVHFPKKVPESVELE